jgi:hypothetical protein
MTTFANLIDSVITVTRRPDLTAEITLALKKAIVKEHSAIDYPRDLKVQSSALTQPSPNTFRYSISLPATARKIKYIKEAPANVDSAIFTSSGQYGILEFKEKNLDNLFDAYSREAVNYYTRFGTTINLAASRQVDNVTTYYYDLPDLSNTAVYSDWLADLYDYVLYTHAAAEIFRITGKTDEYKIQLASIQDNRLDIIKSEIGELG